MNLDLNTLKETNAFSGAPVKQQVTWRVGENEYTADVWVRRLSYYSAMNDIKVIGRELDIAASRIASCIVDEAGKPVFKISDITGVYEDGAPVLDEKGKERGAMCADLVNELIVLISEVNDLKKT